MDTVQGRAAGETIITTVRLPRLLRDEMKIQAIRLGRSFNTHVAMILREAAGEQFGDQAPAAVKAQQNHSEAPSHAAE